jgi:hypothetical protein
MNRATNKYHRDILISKQSNLRKLFRLFGVDFADLANSCYLGAFNDSTVDKFEGFLDVFGGVENPRLTLYLMDVCNMSMRDSRTPNEYGREVMRGWLVEDCVAHSLRNLGLDVRVTGADSDREFFGFGQHSPNYPDLEVNNRSIEIVTDWTGHWSRNDSLDLRENKVDMLYKHDAIIIGVCPMDGTVLMLDTREHNRDRWSRREIDKFNKSGYTIEDISSNIGSVEEQLIKLERKLTI